jgi:two-component system chemotaxis response regulator CheB
MPGHNIIAVGGSAGALDALRDVVAALPADLPAALFVTTHLTPYAPSYLPEILSRAGPLPVRHPEDREPFRAGTIYLAPPDHHLLVGPDAVRVIRGPRENNARPAIDPMLRTAAVSHGPRVIGVVLTGLLDDGTVGLAAVKARGGVTVVQDPKDAAYPDMPASAMEHVAVDHCLPLAAIGPTLNRLARQPAAEPDGGTVPNALQWEAAVAEWDLERLQSPDRPGRPSAFTCPDCKGDLWEIDEGGPIRFRCRTGHAWSPLNLTAGQADAVDAALNEAFRALLEQQHLEGRLSERAEKTGTVKGAAYHRRLARDAEQSAAVILGLLTRLRSAGPNDVPAAARPEGE